MIPSSDRFMLVEDHPRLARLILGILQGERLRVCASEGVAGALKLLAGGDVDAAILDIQVEDGVVYPVADALVRMGIPFGFCSSMEPCDVPTRHRPAPFLRKPFALEELVELVGVLKERSRRRADAIASEPHRLG